MVLLGLFCVHLNSIFYVRYGPFWDSVSYDDLLARVMLSVRAGDPFKAFALIYTSTVALPWLEAMALAPWAEPSRAVAVWLQLTWLTLTALVGYAYFRRVACYRPVAAACCALLFFVLTFTFYWGGGLTDFRLDYLQYALFGLSCFVYLMAKADGRFDFWVLWGAALGLACLGRATTPVFAVVTIAPFFVIDLWQERAALGAVILRYAAAAAACVLVSGWYFLTNLSHLYFYYVDWNWNANSKLPISVSAEFVPLVYGNIGKVGAAACLALFGVNVACAIWGREGGRWNWRALWCGIAPLAYLIASGATPYGAVCQVAVFGFVLFAVAPIVQPVRHRAGRLRGGLAALALAATTASGVVEGFHYHTDETGEYISQTIAPRRANIAKATGCIADDIRRSEDPGSGPDHTLTYAMLYTGMLNSEVITNVLLFDEHDEADVLPNGLLALRIGRSRLTMDPFRVDRLVTPVQWAMIDGADDAQKIDSIAEEVAAEADYIIAPSPAGTLLNAATIDRYAASIADRIAARVQLTALCRDIEIGPGEFASIFRNLGRAQPASQ